MFAKRVLTFQEVDTFQHDWCEVKIKHAKDLVKDEGRGSSFIQSFTHSFIHKTLLIISFWSRWLSSLTMGQTDMTDRF